MNRDKSSFGIESLYKRGTAPSSLLDGSIEQEDSLDRDASPESSASGSIKNKVMRRGFSMPAPSSPRTFSMPTPSSPRTFSMPGSKVNRSNSVTFDDDDDAAAADDDDTPGSDPAEPRSSTSGKNDNFRRVDSPESSAAMEKMSSVVYPDAHKNAPDLSPSNSPVEYKIAVESFAILNNCFNIF